MLKFTTPSLFEFLADKKISQSTQTVDELRVSPFMPIDKISKRSVTYKKFIENKNVITKITSYGKVSYRNRLLTRKHKELFDCIMAYHKKSKVLADKGEVILYFSLHDILKRLRLTWNQENFNDVKERLKEIRDVVIERKLNSGKIVSYNIFTYMAYSERENLYGVILSAPFTSYFMQCISVNYDKRLPELLSIKGEGSALAKSIIDFFISHKADENQKTRIGLMQLLDILNFPCDTTRQITSAKSIIKRYSEDLKKFGITYNKKTKMFEYSGTEDICFIPPVKNT